MKQLLVALSLLVTASLHAELPSAEKIYSVVQDYLARRPSPGFGVTLSMDEALIVQRAFVAGLEPDLGLPVGYKVGLVSRVMQERFHTTQPVRGVLLEKMLVPNDAEVPASFGTHLLLEADLIVTVKDKGIHKATTHLEVLKHLKEVVAFIELPDSFLSTNVPMDAAMLTAVNVGARLGVLGQRTPVKANRKFVEALAAMRVSLSDETGAVLGKAQGLTILDHPLNAVLWLVEELNQAGITLKPGDLLSLGSVMMITPAPAGKAITVRYEGLPAGVLKVSVRLKSR